MSNTTSPPVRLLTDADIAAMPPNAGRAVHAGMRPCSRCGGVGFWAGTAKNGRVYTLADQMVCEAQFGGCAGTGNGAVQDRLAKGRRQRFQHALATATQAPVTQAPVNPTIVAAIDDAMASQEIAATIDAPTVASDTDDSTPDDASDLQGYEGRDTDEVLAEMLAPASAHLSPFLSNLLATTFRPVIEAATQPPRVVTQQTLVNVGTASNANALPLPVVTHTHTETAARVFGLSKAAGGAAYRHALDNELTVCDCASAPAIDRDYIWQPDMLAQLVACEKTGMNAWLAGHKGTGKTEGAMQYAARLHRPFVRIALNRETQPGELLGQFLPTNDGGFEWHDGLLTRAFRTPYCVLLIDEPTLLRSGSLAVFQTVLDTREIHLSHGEIVRAAPGLFIIAADNTAGTGDESGIYTDTSAINAATQDRFGLIIQVDFLPAAREASMLAQRTGIPAQAARLMADFAALSRDKASKGEMTLGVTFRRLLSWARAMSAGIGSQAAFAGAVQAGVYAEDKEPLAMLANANLGATKHAEIDALVRGEATPAAPAIAFPADDSVTTLPQKKGA